MLERWAVRGVDRLVRRDGQGPGEAQRRTAARPERDRAVAGLHRLAVSAMRATTRRRSRRSSCRRTTARSAWSSTSRRASASRSARWTSRATRSTRMRQVVGHMSTRPEGFWWFQKGEYDEEKLDQDLRERSAALVRRPGLHRLPGDRDSLVADTTSGKAVLHLTVDEGQQYAVGRVRHAGESPLLQRRADGVLSVRSGAARGHADGPAAAVQPLGMGEGDGGASRTSTPTTDTSTPRCNPRRPGGPRRTASRSSTSRWTIREGSPATINKVEIVGNDVTHERVIREAIVHAPGRPVQPRPPHPLVSERLQPGLLPAADAVART